MSPFVMLVERSSTIATSSGLEGCPQNPLQDAPATEPVEPSPMPSTGREEEGHEVRGAHDDRVAELAGERVARVERATALAVPSVDPSAAAVGPARELHVGAVGSAVALGVRDRAPERDVERGRGQLWRVRERDLPRHRHDVVRLGDALGGQLAGAGERPEVHGRLQHLALVTQASQVDREGHRTHQHHEQQGRDDHDRAVLLLEPIGTTEQASEPAGSLHRHCPSNRASDTPRTARVSPSPTKLGSGVM